MNEFISHPSGKSMMRCVIWMSLQQDLWAYHTYVLMSHLNDIATKHVCPMYEFLSHPRELTTTQMFRPSNRDSNSTCVIQMSYETHIGDIKSSYVTQAIRKSSVWVKFLLFYLFLFCYSYPYLQPKVILCFVRECANFSQCQWVSESGY